MKPFTVAMFTLFVAALVLIPEESSWAQSGSRNRGRSRVSGGRSSARPGYRAPNRNSFSAQANRRLQQQAAARERELLRQREVQQLQSRLRYLERLGNAREGTQNQAQIKRVEKELKKEFVQLRRRTLAPEATMFLKIPFRLPGMAFDAETGRLKWPQPLGDEAYRNLVQEVEAQVAQKTAPKLDLSKLEALNQKLAKQAVKGELSSQDYVAGRQFVTGLAIELTVRQYQGKGS